MWFIFWNFSLCKEGHWYFSEPQFCNLKYRVFLKLADQLETNEKHAEKCVKQVHHKSVFHYSKFKHFLNGGAYTQ